MKQGLAILLLLFVLASCKKETSPSGPATEPAKTMLNVQYSTDPSQNMDVYLPAGRSTTKTKVIILIHGGAWSSGDKNDFNSYIDTLKKRLPDYAIININYRLAAGTNNLFPTQELDAGMALTFINSKKDEYKISSTWVLLGASAGGHLALLEAYKYQTTYPNIKAVVDFFGPTDLTDMYNNPASIFAPPTLLSGVIGATPTSNPTIYTQSSPVTFVNALCPPTIILQGGVDPLVSPNQSVMLKNKLTIAGVTNQYVYYPSEGHGWTGANLSDSFDKITSFLTIYVQ